MVVYTTYRFFLRQVQRKRVNSRTNIATAGPAIQYAPNGDVGICLGPGCIVNRADYLSSKQAATVV